MSFKREGDDKGLLNNLRRRRIKELFAEDIPEDEAKLLSNGRFACVVCHHNPIFDTVNMLAVHRQGKKHAAGAAEFFRKKKEVEDLIIMRKHEQYMKDGTTNIRQAASSTCGGILTSGAYDPRVRKHKLKPYDRKPCVDLVEAEGEDSPTSSSHHAFNMDPPTRHSSQLKNIFRAKQQQQGPVQPYVSQRRLTESVTSTPQTNPHFSETSHTFGNVMTAPQTNPTFNEGLHTFGNVASAPQTNPHFNERLHTFGNVAAAQQTNLHFNETSHTLGDVGQDSGMYSSGAYAAHTSSMAAESTVAFPNFEATSSNCGSSSQSSFVSNTQNTAGFCLTANKDLTQQENLSKTDKYSHKSQPSLKTDAVDWREKDVCGAGRTKSSEYTKEKTLMKKYHQISGSGWKKDWDGKWIRDEDAEFDSDEEPPDLP